MGRECPWRISPYNHLPLDYTSNTPRMSIKILQIPKKVSKGQCRILPAPVLYAMVAVQ